MPRVLVIEDTRSVLSTILDILRVEQYDVYGAGNGLGGLRMVREIMPDVVICDIMMPMLDGYGVLRELRGDPQTATIPVILLTAMNARTDMRQGMELGANDFITKPFEPLELLRAVRAQLSNQAAIAEKYAVNMETLRRNIAYALPHELRTPLVGIEGYARLLMMDYDRIGPEKILEYATWMVQSSERLQHLIENCLVYAQIEIIAGDPEQLAGLRNHHITNPAKIIAEEAHHQAKEAGREADLRLNLNSAPLQISVEDLRKLVAEIAHNAFKFSETGQQVEVASYFSDGVFTLCISDNGRGMTAEQIANVGAYMQFERALYEQQGVGLGLIVSKRLAELHGGQLDIRSTPGTMTEVAVQFPIMSNGAVEIGRPPDDSDIR
jgi:two-component system, sensor histidine kinase and response regulator